VRFAWLHALPALLAFAAFTASAQSILNPSLIRPVIAQLDGGRPGEPPLRCSVAPIKPWLNFGFRFQAGYTVAVPMSQYIGSGHGWATMLRITPEGGERLPVYLGSRITLPPVPKTKVEGRVSGGYLLGEGVYDVRLMVLDDSGRVCRKSWRVDVHLGHADHNVQLAMPPDTVRELGRHRPGTLPQETDDAAPRRLTIFLHTAPLLPRRTHLRAYDIGMLLSTVSSLLDRVPARSVRLVLFNLDQQKELYRKEDFLLRDMPQVSQAMAGIELGLVDFQVLQNKLGHVDLLADLVNRELEARPPSDIVLFLGPPTRYLDRVPPAELEKKPAEHGPQFYFFQIAPFVNLAAELPDTIRNAVSRLGGKTILIHTPGEFAKAIDRIEKGGR